MVSTDRPDDARDSKKEESGSKHGWFDGWVSSSSSMKFPGAAGESSVAGACQASLEQWLGFIDLMEPRSGEFVECDIGKQRKADVMGTAKVIDLTVDDEGDAGQHRQDTKGKMVDRRATVNVIDLLDSDKEVGELGK